MFGRGFDSPRLHQILGFRKLLQDLRKPLFLGALGGIERFGIFRLISITYGHVGHDLVTIFAVVLSLKSCRIPYKIENQV